MTRIGFVGARFLNTVAALAWLERAAHDASSTARDVAQVTGADPARIAREIADLRHAWAADPFFSAPRPAPPPVPARDGERWSRVVTPGLQPVRIVSHHAPTSAALATRLTGPAIADADPVAEITLAGDDARFAVWVDGRIVHRGEHLPEARSTLLLHAVRASYPHARFLTWLHAAAVVDHGGAVLIAGEGGRGKSTLSTALVLDGWRLVAEDLVPLERESLRVRTVAWPVCLREAGARALAATAPEIAGLPARTADGEAVRVWDPGPERCASRSVGHAVACLVFPHFDPTAEPAREALDPIAKLAGLVESWSMLPRTSADLAAFLAWLKPLPAWRITYPDTASALRLIEAIRG